MFEVMKRAGAVLTVTLGCVAAQGSVTAQAQTAPPPGAAAATARTRVGILRCEIAGNVAFVFGSSRSVICDYTPIQGAAQRYTGDIERFGPDLGFRQSGVMLWGVMAAGQGAPQGVLAGRYGGASADVSFGVGGGVSLLLGGNVNGIALQPISIEGDVGLNIGAGITMLTLRSAA